MLALLPISPAVAAAAAAAAAVKNQNPSFLLIALLLISFPPRARALSDCLPPSLPPTLPNSLSLYLLLLRQRAFLQCSLSLFLFLSSYFFFSFYKISALSKQSLSLSLFRLPNKENTQHTRRAAAAEGKIFVGRSTTRKRESLTPSCLLVLFQSPSLPPSSSFPF